MKTALLVSLYLIAIIAANIAVATFGPAITLLTAFAFIGLDLTSRDALQDAWQRRGLAWKMALLIASGSLLSFLLDGAAGPIAIASLISFGISMSLEFGVYTLFRQLGWRWLIRSNGANLFGACADSLIFPSLAFGGFMPLVSLGQFAAKVLGGALWSVVLNWLRRPAPIPAVEVAAVIR